MNLKEKNLLLAYFSLFSSLGTILCCALPSALVFIGMGATFAGLIGAFPQIVWLSENKILIFIISGILIFANYLLIFTQKQLSCPTDPVLAKACIRSRKWSLIVLTFSTLMWMIGFFFAFLATTFLI